jgi:hypothetical protein
VPAPDFLASNLFAHAGTWNVLSRPRDAFSAALDDERPATWYWFDSGSERLARIMNIRTDNDYRVAVLGAYYLVDFPSFRRLASSNLGRVHAYCASSATHVPAVSSMVTLRAILAAMAAPPSGSQIKCTLQQIQALIPGISYSAGAVAPPVWTDRVHHRCYMIGQPPFPYYGQVWYDWSRGMQVTVLVGKSDKDGLYGQRFDLFLPREKDEGPRIHYTWNGSAWTPACQERLGVAMPWPDFVERGHGRCRAILEDNPYFGSLTIWSVRLPGESTDWSANFWFWFDPQQRQVIFSLDPPNNLTLIDFQMFVRDAAIEPCLLAQPSGLPDCSPPPAKVASSQELRHFMSSTSIKPARNPHA